MILEIKTAYKGEDLGLIKAFNLGDGGMRILSFKRDHICTIDTIQFADDYKPII